MAVAMVVRAVAVAMAMVVPGVAVAVLAQDHKDEHVDEHARQRQEEHHCAARRLAHVLTQPGRRAPSERPALRQCGIAGMGQYLTGQGGQLAPVLPGRARLPSTGTGLRTRSTASTTRMPVTSHVLSTLASAPSTSILWYLRPARMSGCQQLHASGPHLPWRMHARRTAAARAAQPQLQNTLVHPSPTAGHKSHSRHSALHAACACARLTHARARRQELAVRASAAASAYLTATHREAGRSAAVAQCVNRKTCLLQWGRSTALSFA